MGRERRDGMGRERRDGMGRERRDGMGRERRDGMGRERRDGMGRERRDGMGRERRDGIGRDPTFLSWYFCSSCGNLPSFWCCSTTSTVWVTRWLAESASDPTLTRIGSRRNSEARDRIDSGQVAVNMTVLWTEEVCWMIDLRWDPDQDRD